MLSKKLRIVKGAVIGIVMVVLAIWMGIHTASLVLERKSPEIALQLNSKNGKAIGRLALQDFSSRVAEGATPEAAALAVAPMARQALGHEPLQPSAHAILALAAKSREERKRILEQALKLNRRSATLLGTSLQEELADENLEGVIATLDIILRVHPEMSKEFFPVLAGALADDQSLPVFEQVLASRPPWQDSFLTTASGVPAAVINVAELRRRVSIESDNLDALLVSRLAAAGEWEAAQAHYDFLEKRFRRATDPALRSDYPPIDWKLADSREKRAQLSRDGAAIELFVRAGSGGIVMERIFPAKGSRVLVKITHDIQPSAQLENVRLQAKCAGEAQLLMAQNFADQSGTASFEVPASTCDFVNLAIYARVPSVSPALRGSILSFKTE